MLGIGNIFLLFITIFTNYFLIQKYGINGAAIATAISIFIFNTIRLIIIKVKMNMHPFSKKTIYTILLIFITFFLLRIIPSSGVLFFDMMWRSIFVIICLVSTVLYFNLSDDISVLIKELKN